MKKAITTGGAPPPVGPYSQAIVDGGFVFVSGQGPIDPASGKVEAGDVRAEIRRTLENLRAILETAGSSLDKVVKVSLYLKDIRDFPVVNEVYASFFPAPAPARTTIQAGALPMGFSVEIDCIARA
jgi:2-iminobutanoate/2-iminopropanoate deaminase